MVGSYSSRGLMFKNRHWFFVSVRPVSCKLYCSVIYNANLKIISYRSNILGGGKEIREQLLN